MSNRLGWVWCALTCVLASGLIASCGDSTNDKPTASEAGMSGAPRGSGGEGATGADTAGGRAAGGNAAGGSAAGSSAAGGEAGGSEAGGSDAGGSGAAGGGNAGGSDAGAGGNPITSAGAGGEGPAVISEMSLLAVGCSQDSDCGSGLSCVSPGENFEGTDGAPAGGLCTKACETDADCRAFDARAVCGTLTEAPLVNSYPTGGEPRVCLLGCGLGANAGLLKCQGRSDLACRPFAGSDSVQCGNDKSCPSGSFCYRDRCRELACGPRCNSDLDCEDGRYCDPFSGLCTEADPEPVPLGLECNDSEDSPSCGGGNCLVLFDKGIRLKGMCTQSCTFGERCGEGEGKGACIAPRFNDYGVGDIAYCQPLCNCNADCRNAKDVCYPWGEAYVAAFGSRGVCDLAEPGAETLDCSGEGGAGGGGAGGASSNEGGGGGAP